MSYSTSKRVRSRASWRLISSITKRGKHKAACLMLGVRQRIEAFGKISSDRESAPGSCSPRACHVFPAGSLTRTPSCTGFVRSIRDAGRWPIAQVIPLVEKRHVLARGIRLLCGQSGRTSPRMAR